MDKEAGGTKTKKKWLLHAALIEPQKKKKFLWIVNSGCGQKEISVGAAAFTLEETA